MATPAAISVIGIWAIEVYLGFEIWDLEL